MASHLVTLAVTVDRRDLRDAFEIQSVMMGAASDRRRDARDRIWDAIQAAATVEER